MVRGHLQAVDEDGCAARADAAVGEPIQDLMKSLNDSIVIELRRNLDAIFGRALLAVRSDAAAVRVTEGAAAHGW